MVTKFGARVPWHHEKVGIADGMKWTIATPTKRRLSKTYKGLYLSHKLRYKTVILYEASK